MRYNERMLEIAEKLIAVSSINETAGEKQIADVLEEMLRSFPYFQKHPEQVIRVPLKDDPLERASILALLRGEKDRRSDTLLFHGHIDTVGIDDFGAMKPYAFSPRLLAEKLKDADLEDEVRKDLESGDYMFGRGSCDMKSGDAVFIGLLEELSAHPEVLSGNILLSLNPMEESLQLGILSSLEAFENLKEKYGLTYQLAINNDYICPLFEGDSVKTLYTGVVGKVLPCVYIRGKETHVGQCFEGFDASAAAARLVAGISLNTDLIDGYEGEYTMPPSVLKMKDLKTSYNVQTACEAFVYFNWFLHQASIDSVTEHVRKAAEKAMRDTLADTLKQAELFRKRTGQKTGSLHVNCRVMTYNELRNELIEKGYDPHQLKKEEQRILEEQQKLGTDVREIPIALIRFLLDQAGIGDPAAVIYYGAPICPHNTLQKEDEAIIEDLGKITETVSSETGDEFRIMRFFPSLSDSSYLKLDESEGSLQAWMDNFPGYGKLYEVPLDAIRRLNIPAVDFGCYGKDAHKRYERVNVPYTFHTLPVLLQETLKYYGYLKEEVCPGSKQ